MVLIPTTQILQLPVAVSLTGTEYFPVVQGGTTKRAEVTLLSTFAEGVTSVAMTVPSFLSVAGSPITSTGTLAVTLSTQAANLVFAGPTSGGAATPTFRAIVAADLPGTVLVWGS